MGRHEMRWLKRCKPPNPGFRLACQFSLVSSLHLESSFLQFLVKLRGCLVVKISLIMIKVIFQYWLILFKVWDLVYSHFNLLVVIVLWNLVTLSRYWRLVCINSVKNLCQDWYLAWINLICLLNETFAHAWSVWNARRHAWRRRTRLYLALRLIRVEPTGHCVSSTTGSLLMMRAKTHDIIPQFIFLWPRHWTTPAALIIALWRRVGVKFLFLFLFFFAAVRASFGWHVAFL